MSIKENLPKLLVLGVVGLGVAAIAWKQLAPTGMPMHAGGGSGGAALVVQAPETLSPAAQAGEALFDDNCAACHGERGAGSDSGPPLIHDIYNPGHHADMSFVLAAAQGVRAHHWRFGDMPPQPQVSRAEVEKIVAYVREVQQANGIVTRPHRM